MPNQLKHHDKICRMVLIGMIFFLFTGNAFSNDGKEALIRIKMAEITAVQEQISGARSLAVETLEQLNEQNREYEMETREEVRRSAVSSYNEAIKNPRIHNNLKLMGKLDAYITFLLKKISYFRRGNETLDFLYRRADDDLKILQTLNDIKVNKLAAQIDDVLNQYSVISEDNLIDMKHISWSRPEVIWKKAIR